MVVCNSQADPERVKPGEEFTLKIAVCNAGSLAVESGMVTFGGGPFVNVGPAGHNLKQIPPGGDVDLQQRMRAVKDAPDGTQSVEINIEVNDPFGNHYTFLRPVSLEIRSQTPVYSGPPATPGSPPRLLVVAVKTDPKVLKPGEPFDITLTVENLGERVARDVLVYLPASEKIAPVGDGCHSRIGQIAAGERVETTLSLRFNPNLESNYHLIEFDLDYSDTNGNRDNIQQAVNLEVQANMVQRPKLIISSLSTSPEVIHPGDTVNVTLQIDNVGGLPARQVVVTLGGMNGEGLRPFAPLGSGNVRFLPAVPTGEKVEVDIVLILDGFAEARAYPLLVGLDYSSEQNLDYAETQVISLQVHNRPVLQIGFYKEIPPAKVGQSMRLPIEVINLSVNKINIITMEVSSDQMDVQTNPAYVGRLDMGGVFTLDVNAMPRASGIIELQVALQYLDDYNQSQIYHQYLTVEVGERVSLPEPTAENPLPTQSEQSFWQNLVRVFLGIFGIGS
jgi:hypothetical protein